MSDGITFLGTCEYVGCEQQPAVNQTEPFDAILCRNHFPLIDKAFHNGK